jgi:hypothetical protein
VISCKDFDLSFKKELSKLVRYASKNGVKPSATTLQMTFWADKDYQIHLITGDLKMRDYCNRVFEYRKSVGKFMDKTLEYITGESFNTEINGELVG